MGEYHPPTLLSSVSSTQGSWRLLLHTQLWRDSTSLVTLLHTYYDYFLLSSHRNTCCPKCIYTNTSYVLFTNVATARYRYYYYCYNNKQSSLCCRLFDCRLLPNNRFLSIFDYRFFRLQIVDSSHWRDIFPILID